MPKVFKYFKSKDDSNIDNKSDTKNNHLHSNEEEINFEKYSIQRYESADDKYNY
jgi:hypothetical protein